ncbi:MAG: hypothetical protein ACLTS6_13645 [Anaerobutyricum sp.]
MAGAETMRAGYVWLAALLLCLSGMPSGRFFEMYTAGVVLLYGAAF